jgi:hypothetical protein
MSISQIHQRIRAIKAELSELGPLHPGTLTEQYNVCGTPGCRCKDPNNPVKHGPYHQLSFTWRGKSTSRFVREPRIELTQQKLANYKRLRELTNEWVGLEIALEALEREAAKKAR